MIVKYSKKFPYAPYLNEDIGFEESIVDGASEGQILDALRRLSDVALKFHKENNPQIQFDPELNAPPQTLYDRMSSQGVLSSLGTGVIPSIDYKAKEKLEIAIDNATTIHDLEFYADAAEKHGLVEQYMNRLKQLQ